MINIVIIPIIPINKIAKFNSKISLLNSLSSKIMLKITFASSKIGLFCAKYETLYSLSFLIK
jgi:hypothetical protein